MLISCPHIEKKDNGWYYVTTQITRGEKTEDVWYAVEEEYGKFLVDDRLDAFVIPFLPYAMEHGEDIVCEAPVTNRLLYQLNHYLIPILAKHIDGFKPIKIVAEGTNVVLPCANAVGTGWTGGVDSMYTAMKHLQIDNPHYKLTHLVIANCGTLGGNCKNIPFETEQERVERHKKKELTLDYMLKKTRNGFAQETNLKVIGINSNIHMVIDEGYSSVAVYRLPAAILVLQQLFSIFYHSSGYELLKLIFSSNSSASYEFFPLWLYETDDIHFYSTGSEVPRIEKIKQLCNFPLAQHYLHSCADPMRIDNCGKCGKCILSICALYALGELDKFAQVFNVENFYQHKDDYFSELLYWSHNIHYQEIIHELLEKDFNIQTNPQYAAKIMLKAKQLVKERRKEWRKNH